MEVGIFLLYSLFALKDENIKNFLIEANNHQNIQYSFVKAKKCNTGKRSNSYVLAPTGKVILKQKSDDGSIGKVCS